MTFFHPSLFFVSDGGESIRSSQLCGGGLEVGRYMIPDDCGEQEIEWEADIWCVDEIRSPQNIRHRLHLSTT